MWSAVFGFATCHNGWRTVSFSRARAANVDLVEDFEIVEECLYCLSASLKVSRIERIPGNSGNSHQIAKVGDAGGKLKIYRLFYVGYQ